MKHPKPQPIRTIAHGAHGGLGTAERGHKPREEARRKAHGRRTQGSCSGHERCQKGGCGHPNALNSR